MKERAFLVVAVCVAFFVGAVTWIFVAGYRRPVVEIPVAAPVRAASTEVFDPGPPMGWNSWDSFGTTVSEADFRENAKFLDRKSTRLNSSHLRRSRMPSSA